MSAANRPDEDSIFLIQLVSYDNLWGDLVLVIISLDVITLRIRHLNSYLFDVYRSYDRHPNGPTSDHQTVQMPKAEFVKQNNKVEHTKTVKQTVQCLRKL